MSNVEVMYSVYFIKKTEQSESTLRYSTFDILRFCGSLFIPDPAIEAIIVVEFLTPFTPSLVIAVQ